MILATHAIGTGRPLVVIPTASLDGNAMASAIEPAFAGLDEKWQRIYVDLPGTGSSVAGAPFADAIVDSIQETVGSLIPRDRFGLIGWSYGAYLGAGLVRRWPERVSGLLSVCGGVRIAMDQRDLTGLSDPNTEPDWLDGIDEEFHGSLQQAIGRQNSTVGAGVAALLKNNAPTDDEYFEALHAKGYALSDETEVKSYSGPVSIVVGRCDRIAGFKDQFGLIDGYAHADYTAMSGIGHFLPLEAPAEFAMVVGRWLSRL